MILWIHDTRCEAKLIRAKFLMLGVIYRCKIFQVPWLLMIFQSSMTFHDFSRKFYFSRFSRPCGNPVFWRACKTLVKQPPGGHLNINMLSYQYRDPHVKDKMVTPTVLSLTWESPYLGKTVFILRRDPGPWNLLFLVSSSRSLSRRGITSVFSSGVSGSLSSGILSGMLCDERTLFPLPRRSLRASRQSGLGELLYMSSSVVFSGGTSWEAGSERKWAG